MRYSRGRVPCVQWHPERFCSCPHFFLDTLCLCLRIVWVVVHYRLPLYNRDHCLSNRPFLQDFHPQRRKQSEEGKFQKEQVHRASRQSSLQQALIRGIALLARSQKNDTETPLYQTKQSAPRLPWGLPIRPSLSVGKTSSKGHNLSTDEPGRGMVLLLQQRRTND